MKNRIALLCLTATALAAVALGAPSKQMHTSSASAAKAAEMLRPDRAFALYVDAKGHISLPKNYASNWIHLGSWAVAAKEGESVSQMHIVYTQPQTVEVYNRTGDYPDGAVLVKEVREAKTHTLTTGFAASATNISIWFVMIRDRKGRFQTNSHWKEGWGWALFDAKKTGKEVSEGFDASCKTCHTPQRNDKWVYSFGYPALKKP